MIGVLVNTATVVLGSLLGMLLKRGLPERICDGVMKALGLCTLYIGITGMLSGENALIAIVSMALGTALGTVLDLDGRLERLGNYLQRKLAKNPSQGSVSQGFVTAAMIFCVGAMTIVGSLQSGLSGNHEMIFTKSVLDLVSSFIMASTLGLGVLLAAGVVFLYQGALVLLAQWVAPLLTSAVIAEMTCVGSLAILALGFNMLGITKLKVANFIPALFFPIVLCLFL